MFDFDFIKVICVKDGLDSIINNREVIKNNRYYIANIYNGLGEVYIEMNAGYPSYEGYIGIFKREYFITLAELREKRINKILE